MVDFHYPDPTRMATAATGSMNYHDDVCPTTLFDNFSTASTFKAILTSFNQICNDLRLDPLDYQNFYSRIRTRLNSWKAEKLWALLDKRAEQKEYKKQRACQGLRVLIIGSGPCGLRLAIECALLGCKVVVLEKRDRFSRNNVLHFWPFVIHDLRALGAKFFYPRFCAGTIDHISIRQLQCVLLKVALLFGVEIHENVAFTQLLEPERAQNGEARGWRAQVVPEDHYVGDYEFDVLFGADGKRNTVPGFRRKEFRGKLAIAITANFINRRTEAEERVQEISGVAFIFNQQFFKDMLQETGIDLENIVYYKDDTHYFVMTAKKQSLLRKGVIKQDCDDIGWLLSPENVNQDALLAYAREAADFATQGALPRLDYALNHFGQPDVAMFDFTSLFSSENSCRYLDRLGHRLLIGVVGDSLHEPFWPTGSGCARGFLGVFDAAWMLRQYCGAGGQATIGEVLAERESAYRLLGQTNSENISKSYQSYSIDPRSRYPRFEASILPAQVRGLIETDNPSSIEKLLPVLCAQSDRYRTYESVAVNRRSTEFANRSLLEAQQLSSPYIRHQQLARWYQSVVAPYRVRVDNLTTSFRSGLALLAVLRRYCPEIMSAAGIDENFYPDLKSSLKSTSNWNEIRSKVFDAIRREFGLSPPLSLNDKESMYDYLAQLKDVLVKITPQPPPVPSSTRESPLRSSSAASQDVEHRLDALQNGRRYQPPTTAPSIYGQETEEQRQERHKRRLQTLQLAEELFAGGGEGRKSPTSPTARFSHHRPPMVEKLGGDRLKEVEMMLLGKLPEQKREVKAKKPAIKAHKLDQREVEEMEVRLRETGMGVLLNRPIEPTLSSIESKVIAAKTSVLKERAKEGFKERNTDKYNDFDKNMKELDKWLHKPNLCGAVAVKNLLEQHEQSVDQLVPSPPKKSSNPPPPVPPKTTSPSTPHHPTTLPPPLENADNPRQPQCHFCNQRVYLAEKLNVENLSCHRRCFRCAYCDAPLKLNGYGLDRIDYGGYGKQFFCMQHLNLSLPEKVAKIKQNKEKQQQLMAKTTPTQHHVQRETVADFKPSHPIAPPPPTARPSKDVPDLPASTPTTAEQLEVIEEVVPPVVSMETVDASQSLDSLAKSRDLLSSGIFYSTNTPERAEFEVSLRRRTCGGDPASIAATEMGGDSLAVNLTKALSEDEEMNDTDDEGLLDEEEILRHNVGDESLKSPGSSRASHSNLYGGTTMTVEDNNDFEAKQMESGENDERRPRSDDSENDELSSDEERALTNLLDRTGGVVPSLDETFSLIQTLKTKRRAASREDLDLSDDDDAAFEQSNDQATDKSPRVRVQEATPRKDDAYNRANFPTDMDATRYFTPLTTPARPTMDDSCFKTPARPGDDIDGEDAATARRRLEMGLERLRAENRARARLKSDEELCISMTHRSGTRYRSSSLRDQVLARTKSHDVLSPRNSNPAILSLNGAGEMETLKRKTHSEELSTTNDTLRGSPTRGTVEMEDFPSIDNSPTSPEADPKKPRSFLSKLMNPFGTPSSSSVGSSTPIAKPTVVASESNKETNLLSKIGWKYGPNKRRSRGSLSPQQSLEKTPEDAVVVKEMSPLAMAPPKATVDEIDDISPDEPDAGRVQLRSREGSGPSARKGLFQSASVAPSASQDSLLSADSNISDRDVRRVQRAAAKIIHQAETKRHRQAGEMQRQMEELEVKRQQLHEDGQEAEKKLRADPKNRAQLERWLKLIEERDRLNGYEEELRMQIRELELENQHIHLQQLFRDRLCSPTSGTKSSKQLQEEQQLLEQMLHVVSQRDALMSNLEKHRADDLEKHDPKMVSKKVDAILSKKRYDYRNFSPVFTGTSNGSGGMPVVVTADERRYSSALDSVI